MESLNLLRYLVIRDKVTENQVSFTAVARDAVFSDLPGSCSRFGPLQTGIWTELYKIEDTFIKPLRVGVNMSRAHYKMELHSTQETKKSGAKGQIIVPGSVASHWSEKLLAMTTSPVLLQKILCSPSQSVMRSCPT